MASLITHYGIVKMLSDKLGLDDEVLYGAILPDIIGMAGLQVKEDAHYMDAVIDLPHYDRYIEGVLKQDNWLPYENRFRDTNCFAKFKHKN